MDSSTQKAEETIIRVRSCFSSLIESISQVVVGQEETLKLLTTGILCGGHMLIIGVPGLAKTLMVKALSEALDWKFRRIQFTPDLMPADITGTEILQSNESDLSRKLVFHKGPVFANLILADEINRTPPKTQAALLEAMQEKSVTVSGITHTISSPFIVVATQNPIEQEGTYPLPEAQLDRFMFSIHMDYPDREMETIIAARSPRMQLPEVKKVASVNDFNDFVHVIDQVPVSTPVLDYAVAIAAASRPQDKSSDDFIRKYVNWGVGPRCTQYLIVAAKGRAILEGRSAPEIQDVRQMVLPVMRHRILPNYNALGEGLQTKDIILHLLKTV
jgi:MoxR-like ATPase